MMREIKRRIKRMGYKWSEKGAAKMTRMLLLQLSSTKHFWENHWNEKMGRFWRIYFHWNFKKDTRQTFRMEWQLID